MSRASLYRFPKSAASLVNDPLVLVDIFKSVAASRSHLALLTLMGNESYFRYPYYVETVAFLINMINSNLEYASL